jgi:cell division protein ZapE
MLQSSSPDLQVLYARELESRHFSADRAQSAAIEALEAVRRRLLERPEPGLLQRLRDRWSAAARPAVRGLYLWGPVGRGKTWLMDLFYDSLPLRAKRRSHFHHLMRDVHALLGQLRGRPDPIVHVARTVASDARVLCLDELFVSDIADAMILGELFTQLLARGTTLVITANTPPNDLYRSGLQRARFLPAIALLEHELDVVAVDGAVDYRLRHLQHRALYFDSRAPATREQLRALMQEMAGGRGDSRADLTLQGRKLRAIARQGDAIWFDFATLCEGPRHANDYAELAQEFHTVLLSDVPVFASPQQDNAARRFIALVDEFYDQGVKLIVSAAAAPQELYRGEGLQFEFRRASSRLIEMQSEAYLARAHRRDSEPLGALTAE